MINIIYLEQEPINFITKRVLKCLCPSCKSNRATYVSLSNCAPPLICSVCSAILPKINELIKEDIHSNSISESIKFHKSTVEYASWY